MKKQITLSLTLAIAMMIFSCGSNNGDSGDKSNSLPIEDSQLQVESDSTQVIEVAIPNNTSDNQQTEAANIDTLKKVESNDNSIICIKCGESKKKSDVKTINNKSVCKDCMMGAMGITKGVCKKCNKQKVINRKGICRSCN